MKKSKCILVSDNMLISTMVKDAYIKELERIVLKQQNDIKSLRFSNSVLRAFAIH